MVFGRTQYAQPLTLVSTIDAGAPPTIDDVGGEWLEVVVVPESAAIWIIRDGDLVTEWAAAPR
jgi:hypothetical protein